jgi:1,4-dihydroxy-2-naphthoate octaprenyltransferase
MAVRRALLGFWLEIRVIPVLLWSYTAITLGTAMAWADDGGISVPGYLVAVLMGVLVQGLVAHCINEVTDWRSGTDRDPAPRVISGGSKVIASGLLGPKALTAIGVVATLAAAALGVAAALTWGWVLALYGGLGILGAILYTLPPVRAAYRPFTGEAIAFGCAWACVSGAYVLQTGTLTGGVALAGIAHAATCVAMLMMHHYLDRVPDSRARPPKTTTVVMLGTAGRRYGTLWAAIAFLAAVLLTALVDRAFAVMAVAAAVALVLHAVVDPDDAAAVTRNELGVILAGMAGGLGTAAVLAPQMTWAMVPVAVLVPLEIAVSGAAHRDLMASRAAPAPAAGEGP